MAEKSGLKRKIEHSTAMLFADNGIADTESCGSGFSVYGVPRRRCIAYHDENAARAKPY